MKPYYVNVAQIYPNLVLCRAARDFQASAMVRGEELQLWRLLGSLKPMKKVVLTPSGTGMGMSSTHQFIGENRVGSGQPSAWNASSGL